MNRIEYKKMDCLPEGINSFGKLGLNFSQFLNIHKTLLAAFTNTNNFIRAFVALIKIKFRLSMACFICITCYTGIYAQTKPVNEAFAILDKAIGFIADNEGANLTFDGIAYGLENPTTIFSLPVYQVSRGGYWIMQGNKFELKMGNLTGLCDGKIMVIVEMQEGIMYVDSVRKEPLIKDEKMPDLNKLLTDQIGDEDYIYQGKEMVNGRNCHKIRIDLKGEINSHVLYWVEEKKNTLFLMAEWEGKGYTTYWFKQIDKAPKNHKFDVHLPAKELETYHGYQVFDMRFVRDDMK